MIELNGKSYKLYYLDTCALSELVKDKDGFGSSLLNIVLNDGVIAVALNSIWELKSAPTVYEDVLNLISALPSVILRTEDMIFEEEYKAFEDNHHDVSPILMYFSQSFYKSHGIDLMKIFEEKVTNNKNELAKQERYKTFQILNKNPSNIFTRQQLKSISTLEFSVKLSAYQLASNYIMPKLHEYVERNEEFPVTKFPSLMSVAYFIHYKYLQTERKGSVSDIEDILMSSLYPYTDVVVTESNQCDIIRQIQNRHNFLIGLNTISIKQIKKL